MKVFGVKGAVTHDYNERRLQKDLEIEPERILAAVTDSLRPLIPLLGKGGVRGGLVNIRAESFWKLTEPPLAPPLPRRGIAHDCNSFKVP